jgi:hypothetical protein
MALTQFDNSDPHLERPGFQNAVDDGIILWHYHIGMRLLPTKEKESGNASEGQFSL